MGFKQVFDNLTVKHMDDLRKQIQSLTDYVLNHCFWTYAMLGNFQRSPIWFSLISTRDMTLYELLLPLPLSFLQYQ